MSVNDHDHFPVTPDSRPYTKPPLPKSSTVTKENKHSDSSVNTKKEQKLSVLSLRELKEGTRSSKRLSSNREATNDATADMYGNGYQIDHEIFPDEIDEVEGPRIVIPSHSPKTRTSVNNADIPINDTRHTHEFIKERDTSNTLHPYIDFEMSVMDQDESDTFKQDDVDIYPRPSLNEPSFSSRERYSLKHSDKNEREDVGTISMRPRIRNETDFTDEYYDDFYDHDDYLSDDSLPHSGDVLDRDEDFESDDHRRIYDEVKGTLRVSQPDQELEDWGEDGSVDDSFTMIQKFYDSTVRRFDG